MSSQTIRVPNYRFRIGRYQFGYSRWHRWECSDGMRVVAGHRTPIGAWLAQRKWAKVSLSPE
ncbi:hypothetical protein [Rhodococcus phenolicus]|uniref:hypothetical protein n=1 Tax=Rhodococcus phenolicus TaxID=263849 RepID=UPI000A5B2B10|nr:hypothetical protein [Rhodococcus phenolicus]